MTQAFNLSQLANGVNTSGQLNAAANLYNQVAVANGGTGVSSFTGNSAIISNAAGTVLSSVAAGATGNVLTSNGTTWTSATSSAATSVNAMIIGVASGTWTKPATVKSIKVTVVGGGGNGGNVVTTPAAVSQQGGGGGGGGTAIRYYSAASLPGPQPYTVGGAGAASSFGVAPAVVITGSGGAVGANSITAPGLNHYGAGGAGGTGTAPGGLAIQGGGGFAGNPGSGIIANCVGGSSSQGAAQPMNVFNSGTANNGANGQVYGAGGQGAYKQLSAAIATGGTGASGVVIIEEFY